VKTETKKDGKNGIFLSIHLLILPALYLLSSSLSSSLSYGHLSIVPMCTLVSDFPMLSSFLPVFGFFSSNVRYSEKGDDLYIQMLRRSQKEGSN
jgi:hypothetical protein